MDFLFILLITLFFMLFSCVFFFFNFHLLFKCEYSTILASSFFSLRVIMRMGSSKSC